MDNICVFASSSSSVAGVYKTAARQLGEDIARKGWGIVFGAGTQGLMGELARQARKNNGCLTGVIPDSLNSPGIVYEECDELIATHTMRERKAIMEQRSFAFIALPGGFGTLEEILEIITLKQLGYHNKPVVLMNIKRILRKPYGPVRGNDSPELCCPRNAGAFQSLRQLIRSYRIY